MNRPVGLASDDLLPAEVFAMFARSPISILISLLLMVAIVSAQDRKAEAEALFADAEKLRRAESADSRREAIRKFEAAILIFRELGIADREAASVNNIGYIYARLGDYPKALEYLRSSLELSRSAGDKKLQILALLNMAQTLRLTGQRTEGLDRVNEALGIAREIGNRELEASAFNELGVAHFNDGEARTALEYFEKAAVVFAELGARRPQASLLNNSGRINRMLGDQDLALEKYTKALDIFREEKDKAGEADLTINLAVTYSDLFRIAESLEYYERALAMTREMGETQREALVLNNLGALHARIGEHQQAIAYYARSAEIAQKLGAKRLYSTATKNAGIVHLGLNELEKATDYLIHALELSRSLQNRVEEAEVLSNIGLIFSKKGDTANAVKNLNESLEILRATGAKEGEITALQHLGIAFLQRGEHAAAIDSFGRAASMSNMLKTPATEGSAFVNLARARRSAGDLAGARADIERAIEIYESLRSRLPGQEFRSSFLADIRGAYELYIDILMGSGSAASKENVVRAFAVSEQARARSLLDALVESKTEIRRGVDDALIARERALSVKLNNKESYRQTLLSGRPKKEHLEAAEREIREILNDYQQVRARIRIGNPHYAAIVQPAPLTLDEIRSEVLDPGTVLLEYSLGETRSYAWAVTESDIQSTQLPGRAAIEALVRRFKTALEARNVPVPNELPARRRSRIAAADIELRSATAELGELLVAPFASRLSGKRLVIVPDGILQYLPFAAIRVPNGPVATPANGHPAPARTAGEPKYLIETNEIVYLPSASTVAVLRENRSALPATGNTVSVLADPVFTSDDVRLRAVKRKANAAAAQSAPVTTTVASRGRTLRSDFTRLRFSRTEAQSIARLVENGRGFVALDFEANIRTAASERFGNSQIIHFASHGLVNSEYPELSGIVLSLVDEEGNRQEGFLRLHDIYNLDLNTSLVVLSACETALGKEVRGEGIVGLTRGFMYAGAPSVVASLWRVEDRATADLMRRFYQRILKEELAPAAALREAQRSMLREATSAHPFYWAGFTLQGEWRTKILVR